MLHATNGDSERLLVFGGWSGRKYAGAELRELHIGEGSRRAAPPAAQSTPPPLRRHHHAATTTPPPPRRRTLAAMPPVVATPLTRVCDDASPPLCALCAAGSDWSWKRVLDSGKPPFARAYHSACLLAGGRLLIFGGHDEEKTFRKPHVLDLGSMTWQHPSPAGDVPPPRSNHAAVCLDGTRVLIHGGWEPTQPSSCGGADAESPAARHRAAAAIDAGPATDGAADDRMLSDVWILDTEAWMWTKAAVRGEAPPCARAGHTLVPTQLGGEGAHPSLLLFGGRARGEKALNDLFELCPVAAAGSRHSV